jgi:hypothetical protein
MPLEAFVKLMVVQTGTFIAFIANTLAAFITLVFFTLPARLVCAANFNDAISGCYGWRGYLES